MFIPRTRSESNWKHFVTLRSGDSAVFCVSDAVTAHKKLMGTTDIVYQLLIVITPLLNLLEESANAHLFLAVFQHSIRV